MFYHCINKPLTESKKCRFLLVCALQVISCLFFPCTYNTRPQTVWEYFTCTSRRQAQKKRDIDVGWKTILYKKTVFQSFEYWFCGNSTVWKRNASVLFWRIFQRWPPKLRPSTRDTIHIAEVLNWIAMKAPLDGTTGPEISSFCTTDPEDMVCAFPGPN